MDNCSLCTITCGVVAQNNHWKLVVNENQATLGRVFFALRRHETDVTLLTQAERDSLWDWAGEIKAVLAALFAPDHYNYLFHMNLTPHVHMHIFPRYKTERVFAGQIFTDDHYGDHYDPQQERPLDDALRAALVSALQRELGASE